MRVVACVIWYDEEPDDLARMATSLAGFADGMVALDGAFDRFPRARGAAPWSPPDQPAALHQACTEAGIDLLVYTPVAAGVWPRFTGNEVEKRNASVWLAGEAMGADWCFNCDADMTLYAAGDAREQMAATDRHVVQCDIEGTPTRNVYRYSPGLRHVRSHWLVMNEHGILSGPEVHERDLGMQKLSALDLFDVLQFDHPERTDYWRRVRQSAWYEVRGREGIERIGYEPLIPTGEPDTVRGTVPVSRREETHEPDDVDRDGGARPAAVDPGAS